MNPRHEAWPRAAPYIFEGGLTTDFVAGMKILRKRCKYYERDCQLCGSSGLEDICPVGGVGIDLLSDHDIELVQDELEKWDEEHPEPHYMTWKEWMRTNGLIRAGMFLDTILTDKASEEIDKETAEKLGLEPTFDKKEYEK